MTIPLDTAHGLINHLQPGDRVDLYGGFNVTPIGQVTTSTSIPIVSRLMGNILVVDVSGAGKSAAVGQANSTNVSLRMTDAQAQKVAFASDNGKIWLTLRPAAGSRSTVPGLVTINSDLLGLQPLPVPKKWVAEYLKRYRNAVQ